MCHEDEGSFSFTGPYDGTYRRKNEVASALSVSFSGNTSTLDIPVEPLFLILSSTYGYRFVCTRRQ
jgi:hypothetical protein